MKISIITAVFNRGDTIAQAIASVTSQTHRNYEHIIIDGASSDSTMDVVRQSTHSKMRIVSEPDQGIYHALNKGMQLSTGDIVGIAHSDDIFANDRVLERVADAFQDETVDFVYGDLDYVSSRDTSSIVRRWRSGPFDQAKLGWGWMPPHPALFVRRVIFETLGGYNELYRISGDYEAMLRWLGKPGARAAYLPEVLVKMRVGGESNKSLRSILRKSREDYRALRTNGVGGFVSLAAKNLRKVPQFFERVEHRRCTSGL